MRYVVAATLTIGLLAACAQPRSVTAQSSQPVSITSTYRSPDAAFAFDYPRGWQVEDHWPSAMSYLTSFASGSRCCEMSPADVKVDFQAMTVDAARTAALTFEQRCRGGFGESVVSCKTVLVHGVPWGWVETRSPGYGRTVYALTTRAGRSYAAIAFSGDPSGASLEAARAIFRTFRVR